MVHKWVLLPIHWLPPATGNTLYWMFNNLSNTTISGTRTANTGSVGTNGRARNAGDAFVDNSQAIIINSTYQPLDANNETRLGTNYGALCGTINCNGHNYGGWGGRHYRGGWGAYYEGAALNGYCSSQGGFGSNGSAYNGNDAFNGCTPLYHDVDMAVFVRNSGDTADAARSIDDVRDSSGRNNTLTNYNTVAFAAGKLNNAADFGASNTNKRLETTTKLLTFNSPATMEIWVKLNTEIGSGIYSLVNFQNTNPSSQAQIVYDYNGGTRRVIFQEYMQVGAQCSVSISYNITLGTSNWYHLAWVRTNNTLYGYVNGVLVGSGAGCSVTAGTGVYVNGFTIGSYQGGGAYTNALIDEVRSFQHRRTPEEIKANAQRHLYSIYTSPVMDLTQATGWTNLTWLAKGVRTGDGEVPVSTSSLVAQWNFNETSGTNAASGGSCGATCNGTLTGFASTASQDQAAGTGWTANNKRWGAGGFDV